MSIQALRERYAASTKAANHLLAEKGSAVWSKEDQTKFDELVEEGERVRAQIEAHERMIAKDREDNFADADEFRREKGAQDSEVKKAFNVFLRKSFKDMNAEEVQMVRNTMSTTTGSQGGYSVQTEIASTLIDALKAFGFMRAVASQITTEKGNPLSFPTSDGTSETGEWITQNNTATGADVSFGTVPVNVFKASSKIVAVPFELLQDSEIDVMSLVMKRLTQRIGRLANVGYTTGDGTSAPGGIVTAASVGKTGATGQTLTVVYDDLVDLIDSIDAAYLERNGLAWMMSQPMRRVVRKIKDSQGRPIWTPNYDAGIAGEFVDTLLGYTVKLNNDMAAPAANAKSIAFGDLSQYLIRDAMDVTMFRFDDSAYIKLGQIGFLAWARTGGNLLDVNAVKLYQHSAS